MEGDRFDAPGGKREAKVEEDQAAAAIQAKHRAAARRRKKKQDQEKAGSVEEQKAVKPRRISARRTRMGWVALPVRIETTMARETRPRPAMMMRSRKFIDV